ncbi:MAG: hypothetical protein JWQ66_3738 [Mucilaginibacter sp.]|nr:hypothetical protein [Mucilaginibacter sp.]
MEFNEDKKEYADDEYVDIYSKKAIFWFSFFSYIYGGVLLIINLYAAGYRRAVTQVLLFLLTFYFLSIYAIQSLGIKIDMAMITKATSAAKPDLAQLLPLLQLIGITFAFNIVAGLVLTQYFFKKYFPDDDYYPKPVLQPIIIYIILSIFFRFLL